MHLAAIARVLALPACIAFAGAAAAQQPATPPPAATPQSAPPPVVKPAAPAPTTPAPAPPVVPAVQVGPAELTGLLGHAVVGAKGSEIGHIVDLLVDGQGRVRAAVLDVGGFMGLGNRKVAVAWSALRFATHAKEPVISIEIPPDRIKSWAEYIAGRPVAILGAAGSTQ
jgi:hypothetical protein